MRRRVLWAESAVEDLAQTLEYIAADNPAAAHEMIDRIMETGEQLAEFATGRRGRVHGTYERMVAGTPFIIAYELAGSDINILRVIHGVRDWTGDGFPE